MVRRQDHSCPGRPRRAGPWLLALLGLAAACEGEGTLASPVVRVDLRAKLPPKLQRLISLADDSYECAREVTMAAVGATQTLRLVWRVLDDGPDRYITAVVVEPVGPTRGATSPKASAVVGELRQVGDPSARAQLVPVRVFWSGRRGCGEVDQTLAVELRADAPECKRPELKMKLLAPVE